MRQMTESAKTEVSFMSVFTATVVVGSTLFAYQLTSNISPISTSAEVVDSKTSVEESPVAEMLVSRVALLGFIIVVSVRATTAPTERHSVRRRILLHVYAHHVAHIWLPSFLMLCSFTNQKLAQHDLFRYWKETKACYTKHRPSRHRSLVGLVGLARQ